MITIKLRDLLRIQKTFQNLRQKSILPILNNLKISAENNICIITKDVLDVFIIHSIPCQGSGELLINESVFWNFIGFANTDTITITIKDNDYILQSGETKIKNTSETLSNFPQQKQISNNNGIKINTSDLLGLASIIIEEEIPTQRSFIFVGDGKASGSDGYVGYSLEFDSKSKLSLKKSVLNILSPGEFDYYSSDNYDFFRNENTIFGFVQSEIPYFNIHTFFILPTDAPTGFEISRAAIIRFNNLALNSSKSKSTIVSFTICNGLMNINMYDEITNNKIESVIEVSGEGPEFTYVANQMNKLINAIPYENIRLIPGDNKYYILSPDGGLGLIMKSATPITK